VGENVGCCRRSRVGSTEGEEGILQAKLVLSAGEFLSDGKIDKLVNLTATNLINGDLGYTKPVVLWTQSETEIPMLKKQL
jgi:hypothetical protein